MDPQTASGFLAHASEIIKDYKIESFKLEITPERISLALEAVKVPAEAPVDPVQEALQLDPQIQAALESQPEDTMTRVAMKSQPEGRLE